jgi:hypothetical protein
VPRLLILHPVDLSGESHGLQVQHIDTLAELLRSRGWTIETADTLDPELASVALSADMVLVQMLGAPEIEAIARLRRARGLPTVYEFTDNFLGMSDWASPTHLLHSPLIRPQLLFHASLCDAIQVYAPALARLFIGVNGRVITFDPYVPIPDRVPAKPPGFVLGWGGTRSHEPDLAAIAPAVVAFCARHRDARFHYMGAADVFERHFGEIDPGQSSVRPFGDHASYLDFLGGLHVGLAPLRRTSFNLARTDTRFAAYAANGVVAVLEDGPVYGPHRERARLFEAPEDLEASLEDLYASPATVKHLAERARAWVLEVRNAETLADQRDAAYRSLLSAESVRYSSTGIEDAAVTGDRRALKAAREMPPEEALTAARAIVSAHPAYEQAHLLAARSLERLGRHAEALEYVGCLQPSAVYADLFTEVQARCARKVAPGDEHRYAARVTSPARAARLRNGGSVLERGRAILEHQPYDYFALASTIKLLAADDPNAEELEVLYERACLVSPEDVPRDRRPPHLAPFLPA